MKQVGNEEHTLFISVSNFMKCEFKEFVNICHYLPFLLEKQGYELRSCMIYSNEINIVTSDLMSLVELKLGRRMKSEPPTE